jgi:hypothetical protein
VIEDYNRARPFASFFPGVAGLDGVPMWAFYVNRGQCLSSFGVEGKHGAMLEFFPANRANQVATLTGFRTFVVVRGAGGSELYEPFRPSAASDRAGCRNRMIFSPARLRLEEDNPALGLRVETETMTVPGEDFPGLARRLRFTNTGGAPLRFDLVDGLPWVKPWGMDDLNFKLMSRTAECWIVIDGVATRTPVFRLKTLPTDQAEIDLPDPAGHFCAYFDRGGQLPVAVDPELVFAHDTGLDRPAGVLAAERFAVPAQQQTENLTPCAMAHVEIVLAPGESRELHCVFGHVRDAAMAPQVAARCAGAGWFDGRLAANRVLLARLTNPIATFSANDTWDHYLRLSFLDNGLRGGFPVLLPSASGRRQPLHVFNRIHGDMERDYNQFHIEPTCWSQGNGNFRDLHQNRRGDSWILPEAGRYDLGYFIGQLQLDGYNPLKLRGSRFRVTAEAAAPILARCIAEAAARTQVAAWLAKPFAVGRLLSDLHHAGIVPAGGALALLGELLDQAERLEDLAFGEGYWTDHWIYLQDAIETHLGLFPDERRELFAGRHAWYQPCVLVNPRSLRYVMRQGRPFQSNSLVHDHEREKARGHDDAVRTRQGRGEVYRSTLAAKLVGLYAVKLSTLDPFSVGIEFEAGRPDWNDSNNGLPGIFGSSLNQSIALARLGDLLLAALGDGMFDGVALPVELARLVAALEALLPLGGDETGLFAFWDGANTAREEFRSAVRDGVDGAEEIVGRERLERLLRAGNTRLDAGVARARAASGDGPLRGYRAHDLVDYAVCRSDGREVIVAKRFAPRELACYLEPSMHWLRICGADEARRERQRVRGSELFDRKLGMYKVTGPMASMPTQIGRIKTFAPGWLENESVYLHMQYKFLYELLRAGLHDEFFADFAGMAVPFQDARRYGRSPLENCSFLVSSAHPNPRLHGGGYYARLSGATAEVIAIARHLALGAQPFDLAADGGLRLRFAPLLPGGWFRAEARDAAWLRDGRPQSDRLPAGHYATVLFDRTLLVYRNASRRDTYGAQAVKPTTITLTGDDGASQTVAGDTLGDALARRLREGGFRRIGVELA